MKIKKYYSDQWCGLLLILFFPKLNIMHKQGKNILLPSWILLLQLRVNIKVVVKYKCEYKMMFQPKIVSKTTEKEIEDTILKTINPESMVYQIFGS